MLIKTLTFLQRQPWTTHHTEGNGQNPEFPLPLSPSVLNMSRLFKSSWTLLVRRIMIARDLSLPLRSFRFSAIIWVWSDV